VVYKKEEADVVDHIANFENQGGGVRGVRVIYREMRVAI
jgi:hypothetical protein